MSEKAKEQQNLKWNSSTIRNNSWFFKGLPKITASIILTLIVIITIDGSGVKSTVKSWHNSRDYLGLKLLNPLNINQTLSQNLNSLSGNLTPWVVMKLEQNMTSNLLARWLAPGAELCRVSRTTNISISVLDDIDHPQLSAGKIHEFTISTFDGDGNPRCSGGDYFETDLSGENWKSRPPVKDLGNGTYSLSIQIHPNFTGHYNLTIYLLFRSFEGLKFSPHRFAFDKQLRRIRINFYKNPNQLADLEICKKSDFSEDIWSGRWTRHGKNESCEVDINGRYRCLYPNYPCETPWCVGALGFLESNGWVYSAHCSFRIFTQNAAWTCLQNRWIFFWGDSNHVDSIRNLLNFVLGITDIKSVPRRFDMNFSNPENSLQTVRITSIFNGHWNETMNYEGLNSLRNEEFRDLLKRYFSGSIVPDTMIVNSGLHDGVKWKSLRAFAEAADYGAAFWRDVMANLSKKPELYFRSTIATGGYARTLAFNPNKMEIFNWVFLEKMRKSNLVTGVIDGFDLSYAWHFDNRCNDGVHYGRAPLKAKWRDGIVGHQYFVDLMLVHVLLNAICAK